MRTEGLAGAPFGPGRSLLELCGAGFWRELIQRWTVRRKLKGEALFHQGGPSDGVMVCVDGVIRLERWRGGADDGRSAATLAFRSRGDLFGETGVLSGAPRSASAWAHTDCHVAVASPELFREFFRKHRREWTMLQYALERDRGTELVQGFGDPAVRLAALLVPFVRSQYRPAIGTAASVLDIPVTRQRIAEGLRLGRTETERLLAHFPYGEVLRHRNGRIRVRPAEMLWFADQLGI
ncbi:Crp/Fnr family transcriptional regulator [Kitasatospora purpeofusca]|uniref:Crp/Fnr family transcriptional regulator n=1 Tax=Kitasatospora purpeofusca TaxID=67352 RepID=UPI0032564FAF